MDTLSPADFIGIIHDELGIEVQAADLDRDLDEVAGWDSVHLLALAVTLERRSPVRVPLPDLLTARTLGAIHRLVSR
jgi:acyl carrier protein